MEIKQIRQLIILIATCYLFSATWAESQNLNSSAITNKSDALNTMGSALSTNVATPTPTNNSAPKCVCDGLLLPHLLESSKELVCPECKCKIEAHNTTLIKVVVILVIWIISILMVYMLFLICLDPLLNKRVKASYQEHTNEDDDTGSTSPPMPSYPANQEMASRSNVLNRVGHQQDKWKRQVREQRRRIYDRHTMLN